jgi:molecular chaperone GrpE (heat shock protein)
VISRTLSISERGAYPPGTVTAVLRPGYRLHERLLRPAAVVVSGLQHTARKD